MPPAITLLRALAALLAAALMLTGCSPLEAPTDAAREPATSVQTPSPAPRPQAGTAVAVLATLAVKGRAPMTGYDRDSFGPAWADTDRNGCDTRNDMLARDLTRVVYQQGTRGCVVVSGVLADPYTAATVDYVKGDGFLVDIDHVVALGNAWATGALRWSIRKRAALANDPLNLLPVDAGENRAKSDADAATWLPPSKAFRCDYVARQIAVKAKYELWVTAPEKAAMARVLTACVDHDLPADSGAPTEAPLSLTEDVRYPSCDAVRAAGAAPIRRGEPGYGSHLDRDGDGSACE
ncbi:excalibur calcium-binding domain-containing protein [Nocardioides sp. cx-173]|nr:DUF1524 domain-containing protein [Nocardioides sp. cx-173]MCD4527483.1 excalibur calcium-binding domain-containing protein [Nocardioides sp. cx-173]UGB43179.1 excalibur calcium-binding domain-containing protein [Nocardioides sp. cx-173]